MYGMLDWTLLGIGTALVTHYWGSIWALISFLIVGYFISWIARNMVTTKAPSMREYALITGGSYGIGFEFAVLLVKDGYNVVLVARDEKRLAEAKSKLQSLKTGTKIITFPTDLTKSESIEELYQYLKKESISIDILINNAGVGSLGELWNTPTTSCLAQVDLNVRALTHLTRLVVADMVKKNKGKILNVGSLAGFQPGPNMAVYYATKAYVSSFSQALSYELRNTKVTSTLMCPGPTLTEFAAHAGNDKSLLFRLKFAVDTAPAVALKGYKGMMRGDLMVITNNFYYPSIWLTPLFPNWLTLMISHMTSQ